MLAEQAWRVIFGMPQIAVIMGCLIPIVGLIANHWYKAQKVRFEHDLKLRLIERGMSADEIEPIIAAQAQEPSDPGDSR